MRLIELGVVTAGVVAVAIALHGVDLLIVVVAIIVMVMLHEFGHFATAKLSGMKVTEYFLGFGPRLWSVRFGETEYGVKAIPAGGYVKIVGMNNLDKVDSADEGRAYRSKPFHSRVIVAAAGSAMHVVMAFVLLWVLVAFMGVPSGRGAQISALARSARGVDPAAVAGLRAGDVIVSVDGRRIGSVNAVVAAVTKRAGRRTSIVVKRDGRERTFEVTPETVKVGGENVGRIGIELGSVIERSGPFSGLGIAGIDLGRVIALSGAALGSLFSLHGITGYVQDLTSTRAANSAARSGNRPESIYGAVVTASQAAKAGIGDLLVVLVSLNIFVGMINLVPMLPLDGGHVVIACYERLRSRRGRPYRADVQKLLPATYFVLLLLGGIFLSSLYLDLAHPVVNPFR